MFIKRTKLNNTTYIQITKSFRANNKVRHKVIMNLGRNENISKKDIDDLIAVLQKLRAEYSD